MSNMKCPFCQQELDYLAEDIYGGMYCTSCGKGDLFGNEEMWQELIRTRKALDKANAELDYIKEQVEKSNVFIHARIKTALEQKDE